MKGQKVLFSRQSDEWRTPECIIDRLEKEFGMMGTDLACSDQSPKIRICEYGIKDIFDRFEIGRTRQNYCNPPYSKVKQFVEKIVILEIECVMLLPARTDTRWFHEYIYRKEDVRIEFLKGRLKFSDSKNSAPFPSMLVYFRC